MRRYVFVFAVVFAVTLVAPSPARADERLGARPVWSATLDSWAWGAAADRFGVVVSSDNGSVRALDRRGRTRWEANLWGAQSGNPSITRSRVVVGRTGRVVALSRRDGTVQWQQPMDDREVASVALAGRFVVAGDAAGTLRAFDVMTGSVRWSVRHGGAIRAPARIDLDSDVVMAVWTGSPVPAVRVVDLETGAERWRQPVGDFTAAPQLADGRVFVATGDGGDHAWVAAFDLGTGDADWKTDLRASFRSDIVPAVDARDLVVTDWVGSVSAIDPATGQTRWSTPLNRHVVDARVVLLAHRVAVATADGALFVLDRASGEIVAHAEPRDLNGRAGALSPFGRDTLLVALRVVDPSRIEVHRLP
jgi:outer membrane protein assembly factor BamB